MTERNLKHTMEERLVNEVTNYIKSITEETIRSAANIDVDDVINNIDNLRLYRKRREYFKRLTSNLMNINEISYYDFLVDDTNNINMISEMRDILIHKLRELDLIDNIHCVVDDILNSYNTYISDEIQLLKLTKLLVDANVSYIVRSISTCSTSLINLPDIIDCLINSEFNINPGTIYEYVKFVKISIDIIHSIIAYLAQVHSIYIEDSRLLIRNYIQNEYTILYNMIDKYITLTTNSYIDRCVAINPFVIIVDRYIIHDTIYEIMINAFIVSDINKIDIDVFDIFAILDETCIL